MWKRKTCVSGVKKQKPSSWTYVGLTLEFKHCLFNLFLTDTDSLMDNWETEIFDGQLRDRDLRCIASWFWCVCPRQNCPTSLRGTGNQLWTVSWPVFCSYVFQSNWHYCLTLCLTVTALGIQNHYIWVNCLVFDLCYSHVSPLSFTMSKDNLMSLSSHMH